MDKQTQDMSTGTSAANLETWKGISKGDKVQLVNPPKDFARFKNCFATIQCIRDSECRGTAVYFFLTLDDQEKQKLVPDINYTIRKRDQQTAKDNQHAAHMIKVRRGAINKCDSKLHDLFMACLSVEMQSVHGSASQTQAVQDPPVESHDVEAQDVQDPPVESQAVDAQAVEETTAQADPPNAVVLPARQKARKKRKLDAPADLPVFESKRTERNLKARLDLTDKMCVQSEMKEAKKKSLIGRKIKKVFYDCKRKRKVYEGVVTSMSYAEEGTIYDNGCMYVYHVHYPAVGKERADDEDMSRADVLKYMVR